MSDKTQQNIRDALMRNHNANRALTDGELKALQLALEKDFLEDTADVTTMTTDDVTGNTKTVTSKKAISSQRFRWVFTLPFFDVDPPELHRLLHTISDKFIFQHEFAKGAGGPGYEHYQGAFLVRKEQWPNGLRLSQVKDLLGLPHMHLEAMRGSWQQSIAYCSKKDETYVEGPWDENHIFIEKAKITQHWQFNLLDELKGEVDPRKIKVIVDTVGGKGKTQFSLYMYDHHDALVFPYGQTKDIASVFAKRIDDHRPPKYVIFDIPRTNEDFVNWQAIESIKNGFMFASKYNSRLLRFPVPHVVVFTNQRPDENKLSADRWDIREI